MDLSMASNSLSMPLPRRRMSLHDEVGTTQPFAIVRRQLRREFKVEMEAHLGRYLVGQGKSPCGVESQEIVHRSERHETRLPCAGGRHLTFEEAADILW